jgi:hypothetical protein
LVHYYFRKAGMSSGRALDGDATVNTVPHRGGFLAVRRANEPAVGTDRKLLVHWMLRRGR